MKNLKWVAISAILVVIILSIGIVVAHYAGYDFRIIYSGENIGIASENGEFRLVEMSDSTGMYLLYSVIQLPSSGQVTHPRTVFVTEDFWYHSRYISDYGWVKGTNDFYIYSTDTGTHVYHFNGNTWVPQ